MPLPRWLALLPPVHEAADMLRYVGLRDRLRCPGCSAVGTWKPHGSRFDRRVNQDRPVRRWLCKWCGLYWGPEGVLRAYPNRAKGYWDLPVDDETPIYLTPQEMCAPAYPWRG